MDRSTHWIWHWFRRNILKPGPYAGLLVVGTICQSLAMERNPFWVAFFDGPIHLLVFAWTLAGLLLLSLSLSLYDRFSHRAIPRAEFFRDNAHPILDDWETDPRWIPFDRLFEIIAAPNLREPDRGHDYPGWEPTDAILRITGEFHNAPRLELSYGQWRERLLSSDPKKLEKDGIKYVLRNHPSSETDEHFVRCIIETTRWSRVRSFLDAIKECRQLLFETTDPTWTAEKKPLLDLRKSESPHSLGLHAIVITSDNKLLALQRPPPEQTDYHPLTWSFTFEEQLSDRDFPAMCTEVDVKNWLVRAVRQEILGQDVDRYFNVDKARILSIIHEEEICNPSLVAITPVDCTSLQLESILPHAPDRAEWVKYDFYSLDAPYDALARTFARRAHIDGRALHPTSRYRIYMTLSAITPPSLLDVVQILCAASKQDKTALLLS